MVEFKVLKRSSRSRARLGILRTPHGEVETPCLVPVATQASIKTLTWPQVAATGSQLLIANTFHLHLRPGERVVAAGGGLHRFSGWTGPFMTDSGGFQVFSLGFGRELKTSKVLKSRSRELVAAGRQPKLLEICHDGVRFTSYLDGAELFLGPRESVKVQQLLGADIMFAFDECPPPQASAAYLRESLERTHRWAVASLGARRTRQALYGIVQGGRVRALRLASAKFISSLPFDGFGIGGEFGAGKQAMVNMLGWVNDVLPQGKPRHLLGIGYPEDIPRIVAAGVDTFDCVVPTQFARHGVAFTPRGRLDLWQRALLKDKAPLQRGCPCLACTNHTRSYLAHLVRAHEVSGLVLLTTHNLTYFHGLAATARLAIKRGRL